MIVFLQINIGFNKIYGHLKKILFNLDRIHIKDNILVLEIDNNILL